MSGLASALTAMLRQHRSAVAVVCVSHEGELRIELEKGRYRATRAVDAVIALGDAVVQARVVDSKGSILGVVNVEEPPEEVSESPVAPTSAPTMTMADVHAMLRLCNDHARMMVEQMLSGLKPLVDGVQQLVKVQSEAMTRITKDYQQLGIERAEVARAQALQEAGEVVSGSPSAMEGLVEKLAPMLAPMLMSAVTKTVAPSTSTPQ